MDFTSVGDRQLEEESLGRMPPVQAGRHPASEGGMLLPYQGKRHARACRRPRRGDLNPSQRATCVNRRDSVAGRRRGAFATAAAVRVAKSQRAAFWP